MVHDGPAIALPLKTVQGSILAPGIRYWLETGAAHRLSIETPQSIRGLSKHMKSTSIICTTTISWWKKGMTWTGQMFRLRGHFSGTQNIIISVYIKMYWKVHLI